MWCDGDLVRLRRSLEKVTSGMPPERFTRSDWHGLLDRLSASRRAGLHCRPALGPALAPALSSRRLCRRSARFRAAAVARVVGPFVLAQLRRALRLRPRPREPAACRGVRRIGRRGAGVRQALVSTLCGTPTRELRSPSPLPPTGPTARALFGDRAQVRYVPSIRRARCAAGSSARPAAPAGGDLRDRAVALYRAAAAAASAGLSKRAHLGGARSGVTRGCGRLFSDTLGRSRGGRAGQRRCEAFHSLGADGDATHVTAT